MSDHDRGRRAGDAGDIVVLGQPEPSVAPSLGVAGQVQRVAEGVGGRIPLADRSQVEDGDVSEFLHGWRSCHGCRDFRALVCEFYDHRHSDQIGSSTRTGTRSLRVIPASDATSSRRPCNRGLSPSHKEPGWRASLARPRTRRAGRSRAEHTGYCARREAMRMRDDPIGRELPGRAGRRRRGRSGRIRRPESMWHRFNRRVGSGWVEAGRPPNSAFKHN